MVLVKYKLFWLISLPWDASTDLWFSFYGLWCSMVWEAIKALIRKNDKIPLIPKSNLWAAKQAFTQKKRNKFKHIETKQKPERIDL